THHMSSDSDEHRCRSKLPANGKPSRITSPVSRQERSDINKLEKELGEVPEELELPKKVQLKLKERSKKKSESKKRHNGNNKKRPKKSKKEDAMELPRPTYDKLSGGKTGDPKKDKKSGVIEMLKNQIGR